jgi:hypothetical protein
MAVEQWFTGFMEGVHVAARGNYRNVASLPLLVPCPQPTDLAFDAMIVSDGGELSGEAIDVPDVSPAEEPPPAPPDELPPDHAEPLPSTDEQAGTVQLPEETSLPVYETLGVEIRQPEAILSDEPVLKEGMLFVR